ncbi:MAG: hypothetical protein JWR84_1865 [Caulobacter sp.]|nr:hypothetical protein [Caulobacter sp.]
MGEQGGGGTARPRQSAKIKKVDRAIVEARLRRDGMKYFCWAFFPVVGTAVVIWLVRITQFSATMRRLGDKSPDPMSGFYHLMWDSAGMISIVVTAVAMLFMWAFWSDFIEYLSTQNSLEFEAKRESRQFRVQEELHDPPGDIFTLVGIAFTFVGLALSMATIPSDLIGQIMSAEDSLPVTAPDAPDRLGIALVGSAIVFGSSLAVGLIASLQGIIFSIFARRMAAKYLIIGSSPSEYSAQIRTLPQLHLLLKKLASDFGKVSQHLLARRADTIPDGSPPKPGG